jgi:hypothetical protein
VTTAKAGRKLSPAAAHPVPEIHQAGNPESPRDPDRAIQNGEKDMNSVKSYRVISRGISAQSSTLALLAVVGLLLAACQGSAPLPVATSPASDPPAAFVWEFLDSVKTDSSGSANANYLSPALQAEISSGHPIPELLAVQGQFKSFGVNPSQLLDDGQHALVTAVLNYVSPVLRSFVLYRVKGSWQIETIISYSQPLTEISTPISDSSQVVLQYVWDLASGAPDAAWSLLTSDSQALISQDQLSASASEAKQFSSTNLTLLSELQDRIIYEARLWVSLNGSSSSWTEGENLRFIEMMSTPDGWRISSMSKQPLS